MPQNCSATSSKPMQTGRMGGMRPVVRDGSGVAH